jgi:uncharacterized protein YndB with AHSA1/START domain
MDATRITRSVELDASADDVWRALTEPAMLADWLDVVELDVRPGGAGLIVEGDGAVRRARVEEVDPARRLALCWWPEDGEGPASTVELDLEETPTGTRVVVTETIAAGSPVATASADYRWGVRFLLLGCCLVRAAVSCR